MSPSPTRITTAEKLDALPVGAVVLDGRGRASQKYAHGPGNLWWRTAEVAMTSGRTAERLLRYGTATVLHNPAAPPVSDTTAATIAEEVRR